MHDPLCPRCRAYVDDHPDRWFNILMVLIIFFALIGFCTTVDFFRCLILKGFM